MNRWEKKAVVFRWVAVSQWAMIKEIWDSTRGYPLVRLSSFASLPILGLVGFQISEVTWILRRILSSTYTSRVWVYLIEQWVPVGIRVGSSRQPIIVAKGDWIESLKHLFFCHHYSDVKIIKILNSLLNYNLICFLSPVSTLMWKLLFN